MVIYFSRHGESHNNVKNIIGGDCSITKKGDEYAKKLGEYFNKKYENLDVYVFTSNLKRTIETSKYIKGVQTNNFDDLNEIYSGDFDGMVLSDIEKYHPIQFKRRNDDKFSNKYPNGESYIDLSSRVSKILDKIKNYKKNDVIVFITHKAVSRVIYSYFTKDHLKDCVNLEIKLHNLYCLKDYKFSKV